MKLLFINPASVDNLAAYDKGIIGNITNIQISYVCNYANEYIDQYSENIHSYPFFIYDKFNNSVVRGLSYLVSMIQLVALLLRFKPDVVHIQWPKVLLLDKLFLRVLRYKKIPVVYTAHNLLPHSDVKEKQIGRFKRFYSNITGLIVHTEGSKKELCDKFNVSPDKVYVNKHGILPTSYNESEVEKLKSKFTEDYCLNNKIVFSSIGFQSYYKGLDFIIDYWKNISEKGQNIHLFVAGSCRYDRVYELSGLQNVTIIDRLLTKDELVAIGRISSVILIPYRRISQSGILMSAMNDHIPVLISNVGGLPEPLQIADVGWNMGEPNYENFANTMNYILSHPEDIDVKKANKMGWEKIGEAYDWKNIAEKTEGIYYKVLKQRIE